MPISIRDRLEIGLQHSSEEREDTKLRRTGEFFSDKNIDQVSGSLLRIGVTVSALLVLAGAISYLVSYGNTTPHYHIFRGEPSDLTSIGGILKDLLALHPLSIIQSGLLILIITPVTRVVFAVFAFAVQRDFLYSIVSLIVLGILLYSIIAGA